MAHPFNENGQDVDLNAESFALPNDYNDDSCSCSEDEEINLKNVPTPDGLVTNPTSDVLCTLQQSLNSVVRCVVCKSVPFSTLFQCQHGHLICAGCYQMRVLDKMLGPELGTCPSCSVRIYRHLPNRNLVAENALAQVQTICEFCGEKMKRSCLRRHFISSCPNRWVFCKYRRIGCPWIGEKLAVTKHESQCEWPNKTGAELMEAMSSRQAAIMFNRNLYKRFTAFIQMSNITVRLLHVLPGPIPMPQNIFIPVAQFTAYKASWSILLMIDSTNNEQEKLSYIVYQLRLDNPIESTLVLSYTLMSGTYSEIQFRPNLCERFGFTNGNFIGPNTIIYCHCMQQCLKVVNGRGLYARLLMARF